MRNPRLRELIFAFAISSLPVPVDGHAILLSTTPGVNQIVRGPDIAFKLRFNTRIDVHRSRLVLLGPDSEERALNISPAATLDSLETRAQGLKSGVYVLRWQVLANDGHISRGEVPFRVQ